VGSDHACLGGLELGVHVLIGDVDQVELLEVAFYLALPGEEVVTGPYTGGEGGRVDCDPCLLSQLPHQCGFVGFVLLHCATRCEPPGLAIGQLAAEEEEPGRAVDYQRSDGRPNGWRHGTIVVATMFGIGRFLGHYTGCVRFPTPLVVVAVVAGIGLVGCSSGSGPSVAYPRYQFSCCANLDGLRVWHPGETMSLQWTQASAGESSDSAQTTVTLTAVLAGPFAQVDSLKGGGAAARTVRATAVFTTNGTLGSPVSTIPLPADLAPGYYNRTITDAEGSGSTSSAAIVHVGPRG
jgi:hypothetical protein